MECKEKAIKDLQDRLFPIMDSFICRVNPFPLCSSERSRLLDGRIVINSDLLQKDYIFCPHNKIQKT